MRENTLKQHDRRFPRTVEMSWASHPFVGQRCYECGQILGPLNRPEETSPGRVRPYQPCPEPLRPTGERGLGAVLRASQRSIDPPTIELLEGPSFKSTEGMPHKQHKDRNTTLPPKPTPKPR